MAEADRAVTLCITMGRRPRLLTRTLKSLLAHNRFDDIVAVNDFGDEATNAAYRAVCPQGRLVSPPGKLGHHAAVDLMYQTVTTPYVFHCEDDWLFEPRPLLDTAFRLLEVPGGNAVSVRAADDRRKMTNLVPGPGTADGLAYHQYSDAETEWGGFTFNPNLQPLSLWQEHGPWARFKDERTISQDQWAKGHRTIFATPGFCRHIGQGHSTLEKDRWAKLKRSIVKRLPAIMRPG